MPTPSALEVCRTDLFTKEDELRENYPQSVVDKVLRVREMYCWFISNPDSTDREFVVELLQRHDVSKVTAYSDLAVVKINSLSASAAYPFAPGRMMAMPKSPALRWRTHCISVSGAR